jgi:hypothetical protein
MKCPDCQAKITSTDYDPDFEWYECPKCEGAFTVAEIEATRPSKNTSGKVKAKAKKRQEEISADQEAIEKMEAEMLKPLKKDKADTKHRDELPLKEVVSIMADELQEIYREMGGTLDDVNARDKALTLWREIHYKEGVHAREKPVQHVLCGAHS